MQLTAGSIASGCWLVGQVDTVLQMWVKRFAVEGISAI